ncbi:hypothetical protein WR25_12979 [Diploscapter pachys]|uniref:Uncharacterized protein n=1 Tax=Diploscapter pachys TaxID=2018661 RepID=A0A2A2LJZ6_9BILA|nr:hypothetical protein WR25_12979 [Diploscapter pachys]
MSHSSSSSRRCSANGRCSPHETLAAISTAKSRSIFTRIRRFKATPRHTEQCKQRVERLSLSGIEENGEQEERMNYIPKYLARSETFANSATGNRQQATGNWQLATGKYPPIVSTSIPTYSS